YLRRREPLASALEVAARRNADILKVLDRRFLLVEVRRVRLNPFARVEGIVRRQQERHLLARARRFVDVEDELERGAPANSVDEDRRARLDRAKRVVDLAGVTFMLYLGETVVQLPDSRLQRFIRFGEAVRLRARRLQLPRRGHARRLPLEDQLLLLAVV